MVNNAHNCQHSPITLFTTIHDNTTPIERAARVCLNSSVSLSSGTLHNYPVISMKTPQ